MNTRNAANDAGPDIGPDEPTDPNIEKGAPFDEYLPPVSPNIEAAIQSAARDATTKGMKGVANMRVERAVLGQVSLVEVMAFLREKYPAFVLFVRIGDEDFKNPDGTWKEGMDPNTLKSEAKTVDGTPEPSATQKREWGVFFEGPDTPYDPKARRVIGKWLDMNAVRDFSKDRLRS